MNHFFRYLLRSFVVAAIATITQGVYAAATVSTTTTVVASINPVPIGTATVLTATVTGTSPTGNVTFKKGTTTLGTGVLSGTGNARTATFSAVFATAAANSITAVYAGDAVNISSTSTALAVTSTKVTTNTSVVASVNPIAVGSATVLTATVTGYGPTGNITFKKGTTTLGTAALSGTGGARTATYSAVFTTAAANSITAVYAGNTTDATSTSAALIVNSTLAVTSTAVGASVNPISVGSPTVLTATVSGYNPTGTVSFKSGATTLGSGSLSGTGNTRTATYSATFASVAANSITAVYAGSTSNATSTSPSLTVNSTQATTSTTLTSSLNPSSSGASVTFTATVAGYAPTGTVTFSDGAATLGTGTLSGTGNARKATFVTNTLTGGMHNIVATYSGSVTNAGSVSVALAQSVSKAASAVTLGSSVNPISAGTSLSLFATVTGVSPTGNVTFTDGVDLIGTAALTGTGNVRAATLVTANLAAGTKNIVAAYAGDATNDGSVSTAYVQYVTLSPSSTSLVCNPSPSNFGIQVACTATVNGFAPTGVVTFKEGSTDLGVANVSGAGNTRTAIFTTTALSAGSHVINALYGGDGNNSGSNSAAWTQSVTGTATSTTLATAANPSAGGSSLILTASVTGLAPTGNVNFMDGPTQIGSGVLSGSGDTRTATLAIDTLSVGTHSITAVYAGAASNAGSTSAPVSQTISKPINQVLVVSGANPSIVNDTVTFNVTVSGLKPTGFVSFIVDGNTVAVTSMPGTSNTFTTTFSSGFGTGDHNISASYAGDTSNLGGTSAILVQTVNRYPSSTVVETNMNPALPGSTVTFKATVTGTGPSAPTGSISFKVGPVTYAGYQLVAGTGKTSVASASIGLTARGNFNVIGTYNGDFYNQGSASGGLTQVVDFPPATVDLTSGANPSVQGDSVTLTATVSGNNPTGEVSFSDGASPLGTATLSGIGNSRTATLLAKFEIAGGHSVTAVYGGNATNGGAISSVLSQVVFARPTVAASANPSIAGSAIDFAVTVTGNLPTGVVSLREGDAVLGSAPLVNGIAVISLSSLPIGLHQVVAAYSGDANNPSSNSAPYLQDVTSSASSSGAPMTWQFGYDAMGRPSTLIDPNGLITYTYYDALGRAIQLQQSPSGSSTSPTITQMEYNGADSLTKVIDPRNLNTVYTPTGLGTLKTLNSPDSGVSNYTYDAEGNLATKTDARSKLTTYTYDKLNRLTLIHYASGVDSVFEYDGGLTPYAGATGELTKITDASGQITFAYDALGRLTSKTQTSSGKSFSLAYTWGDTGASLDKLTSITYPSGARVNYSYDNTGQVSAISVNPPNANGVGTSATVLNLLSGLTRNVDSNPTGWAWASGKRQQIDYDSFGQVLAYNLGDPLGASTATAGVRRTLVRDNAGRITAYSHVSANASVNAAALNQSFSYDSLNRLVSAGPAASSVQYTYDASGNRTSKVIAATTYTNTVSPTSNQLTQTQDVLTNPAAIQYDAAGNMTFDGSNTFTYGDNARMSTLTNTAGTVTYSYNALGQRVAKSGPATMVPTGAAYFVYDQGGRLLGEYDANASPLYESIYLDSTDTPVGVIKTSGSAANATLAATLYNVYADQINTPRVITRQSDEAIVWRWDSAEAFGASSPDQNPNALGTFTFNQRFPGQLFDAESGLSQNWNREYNARTGRYIQSDPIGLGGGINTYAYVESGPLSVVDPSGLKKWDWNGTGNTAACTYYDSMAAQHPKCSYYKAAADICRGNNSLVNSAVNTAIANSWARDKTQDSQATIIEKVRQALVAADKKAREDGKVDCNTDCVYGNDIDRYHDAAFIAAGLSPIFYGGNLWPQGMPPNPVPRDPRSPIRPPGYSFGP